MTDAMAQFEALQAMTTDALHARREELNRLPEPKDDDTLIELVAILRTLRKRTSTPVAKKSYTKVSPTLDAL